jgi:hypothetical protein
MAARVVEIPNWMLYGEVMSAKPVRGHGWTQAAIALNWLLGRGGTLIPWTWVGDTVSAGTTETLRFTIYPRYQATHRAWLFTALAATSARVTFTDPSGGSTAFDIVDDVVEDPDNDDLMTPRMHVETITSRVDVATHVEVTIENDAASATSATLLSIACFELPRSSLLADATDHGVEQASLVGGMPIFTAQSMSLGGVQLAIDEALSVARRPAHIQMARFAGNGEIEITGAGSSLFEADVPVLERFLYAGETTVSVPIWIYTRSDVGANGTIDVALDSGSSHQFIIPGGDTGTWRTASVPVHVEDLSASDGRRGGTWDKVNVSGAVLGVGSMYLESFMLGPRSV